MAEVSPELITDASFLVGVYYTRFAVFAVDALINSLAPYYLVFLFVSVSLFPNDAHYAAIVHYASCYWGNRHIKELSFAALLYIREMLPREQIIFLALWHGIPSSAYLLSAWACYQTMRLGPGIWIFPYTWTLLGSTVSIMSVLWFISTPTQRTTVWRWASSLASILFRLKKALHDSLTTFCCQYPFLIREFRIWELRIDAKSLANLPKNFISDVVDDSKHLPDFKYPKLTSDTQIRLIELTKGPFSKLRNITAKIIVTPLSTAPPYSAVSYTWEAQEKPYRLTLNGSSLPITASVNTIIERQTPISGTVRLWIDSICINQDDNDEKSKQISLMKQIYSSATQVIVWIRCESNWDADITAHFLRQFREVGGYQSIDLIRQLAKYAWKMFTGTGNPQWKSLSKVLHDPYWTRTWIIQEVANGRRLRVMCGDREISWDDLQFLIECYTGESIDPRLDVPELINPREELDVFCIERIALIVKSRADVQSNKRSSLKDIVPLTLRFDATDKRDHIYGLLGLTNDLDDEKILPDYSKSTNDVFIDVSLSFLKNDNPLWLLNYAGRGWRRNLDHLPSWTVDWGTKRRVTPAPPMAKSITDWITLWLTLQPPACITSDRHKLRIHGISLGRISTVNPIPNAEHIREFFNSNGINQYPDFKLLQALSDQWDQLKAAVNQTVPDPYFNNEDRKQAFWNTLCGHTHDIQTASQDFAMYEEMINLHKSYKPNVDMISVYFRGNASLSALIKRSPGLIADMWRIIQQHDKISAFISGPVRVRCVDRAFAVTDQGYMVLVPRLTRPQDEIFLFPHAETPFILRDDRYYPSSLPLARSSDRYQLIGDCYIHGLDLRGVLAIADQPRHVSIF